MLESPRLDTRDFESLLSDARAWIEDNAPDWTDLSESDPGMVLVELFAYLTDMMIYRLNTLPQTAYVEFLRLIGVKLHPPSAAVVSLRFSRLAEGGSTIPIPRGTRVTTGRTSGGSQAPVFATAHPAELPKDQNEVEVIAHHCDLVIGELAGTGTGRAAQSVTAQRPPIISPTGDELDLVVGVEIGPGDSPGRGRGIELDGKSFRVWKEVDSFVNARSEEEVYLVDRLRGAITFAPAVRMRSNGGLEDPPRPLAAAPAAGREIRLWYRRGGGVAGNVASGTLTTLTDQVPGLEVTNPTVATGGRDSETLENALIRGPQELFSVEAAVRAVDYEALARHSSSAVARAKAITRASLWRHADPGTVDVLLVPFVPESAQQNGRVGAAQLQEHQTAVVLQQVLKALEERCPLGTTPFASWTPCKSVRVAARVVVGSEEDLEAVKRRVEHRLNQTITPLPTTTNPSGWAFGRPLRAAHVYDLILKEPGVRFADNVRLLVDEVPDTGVFSVTADAFQPGTWYAGSGPTLFRSLNDSEGWEPAGRFPGEIIKRVRVHPTRPGLLAVVGGLESGGSRIHVSRDAGESWDEEPPSTTFEIEDATWIDRGADPFLLLATDAGLYEVPWVGERVPSQIVVVPEEQARGFYRVVASTDFRGETTVAVTSQQFGGVFLSADGGKPGTFRPIGLNGDGEDVRTLEVQQIGPRSFLWAGDVAGAGDDDPGKGCWRWELRGDETPPEGWLPFRGGWQAGACWGLAFAGERVYAATHRGGILRLESGQPTAEWQGLELEAGLPVREQRFLFAELKDLATSSEGDLVMAAGEEGVYRSEDGGVTYQTACRKEFSEAVTLPESWLFASGEHELSIVSEG